ncbi:PREDICTED: uncharacterized protein K02A2.6-like [Thamnophis sirtalis]|uniref:ribonuclease H n=1 Tax=Thamnophis sirtalis TaxID=35019 RepID=A0A6I9XWI1_9SAUR|nr:PREDICTED: uncharacterized protein K02A2.6-like [Thamnophis sirtalis]
MISQYVAELRAAAINCEFADLEDALLEQFIYGLLDINLHRRILSRTELSMKIAVDEACAYEMTGQSTPDVRRFPLSAMPALPHSAVHCQMMVNDPYADAASSVDRLRSLPSQDGGVCLSCGGHHSRASYRFRTALCRKCGKKGHIAAVCRSTPGDARNPRPPPSASSAPPAAFRRQPPGPSATRLGWYAVSNPGPPVPDWLPDSAASSYGGQGKMHLHVLLTGRPCRMELDMGSARTIMSWDTLRALLPTLTPSQLSPADCLLRDYQGNPIPILVCGYFPVQFGKLLLPLVVVKSPLASLMGLDWFRAFGLSIAGINSLRLASSLDSLLSEFDDIFSDALGCYKGNPISLNLDPMVAPIRLKARRVPFALRARVDAEIDKLISQGILEPVDHAPWETPIVPLKSDGSLRVCADYKATLNKALQAHPYPVPIVQHVLQSLGQGKIFAKLDLAQAYQQLLVDEASATAQTIVTYRGAFKCRRLQFGVSEAPSIFQGLMERVLHGIPGVVPYFDNVMIAAPDQSGLVKTLRAVLSRF